LTNRGVKKRDKILTEINQRIANQEDCIQKTKGVISLGMIKKSKGISDITKRITLKETIWQKTSTYTKKKKLINTST